ncbi:MAG: 30S ribosomal protein S17e [Candidatus Bathyarchaeota archaeon]|nr:MAG: 30S ribosomal protein S17e [Candidatus Bathyarchaeota archaeon]
MKDLGKVRPEHVKKAARELLERYPDRFNTDFQNNKENLDSIAQISSNKLRNRIAGYITRLLSLSHEAEADDSDVEEGVETKE